MAEGNFERDSNYITTRITADGRDGFPVEPDRYRLVVARACPWANRAIIVRRLLGLEDVLSMAMCGPTHDERSWTFDLYPGGKDPVLGIERLQQAFFARDPDYSRGITVPAIVDVPSGAVVTNDFAQMTIDFSLEWSKFHRGGAPELYPEDRRDEIDEVAELVYRDVNNGVYRTRVREQPERLRRRVQKAVRRVSTGSRIAFAHSVTSSATRSPRRTYGCSRRSRASTPSTTAISNATGRSSPNCRCSGPTRATCSRRPGFGDTTDFSQIKHHYYEVHTGINPTGIVPLGPDLTGWLTPHGREELGGRPFGDGTPPSPPVPAETVPPEHGPLAEVA